MVEGIDMVEAPSSVRGSLSSSDLFPIGSSDGGSVSREKSTDASYAGESTFLGYFPKDLLLWRTLRGASTDIVEEE